MIDSAIKDSDEIGGQLADGEVARLLSVLQNAEFTKSKTHSLKKDMSFKPRTLIEIAAAAKEREVKVAAVEQMDAGFLKTDALDAVLSEDEAGVPSILEAEAQDLPVTDDLEDQVSGLRVMSSNLVANDEVALQAENEALGQSIDSVAQVVANFETVEAAFERGKAEGIADGRHAASAEIKESASADAKAELAGAVSAFNDALNSLLKPQALQAEALSRSIRKKILDLASERAGQHIDDVPNAFSGRIEALVASIGQKMTDGKVQLSSDDYKVIAPYFSDSEFDFSINANLMRGDVVLKFDGVELHDIAENRVGSHYTRQVESESLIEGDINASKEREVSINELQADQPNSESVSSDTYENSRFKDNMGASLNEEEVTENTPHSNTIEEQKSGLRGMTSSSVFDELKEQKSGLRGMTSSSVSDELEEQGSKLRDMTSSSVSDELEEQGSKLRDMTSSSVSDELGEQGSGLRGMMSSPVADEVDSKKSDDGLSPGLSEDPDS